MKTRLLAVLMVSSLVLASVAPVALAQDAVAVDGSTATGGDVQYVDCSQVVNAVQGQYGDATAIGDRAVAAVANDQNITVNQVNACLGQLDDNNKTNEPESTTKEPESTTKEPESTTKERDGEDEVMAATIPDGTLPNTGGPSLYVAAAAAALIVGGASLMRFRR